MITANVSKLNKVHIIALFVAFSLFLSSIEYLLPRPIPFFRYGLANIALLLVIRHFVFKDVFLLAMLKVIGLGILNGTFASYVLIFSLLGTTGGVLAMWCVARVVVRGQDKYISLVGVSIIGAFVSNGIQIVLAIVYIFGVQAWIIAPYLLLLGTISGTVVGLLAQYYSIHSAVLSSLFEKYHNEKK